MRRWFLILALGFGMGCMPTKKSDSPKTSQITPHYSTSVTGGVVFCLAYYTDESGQDVTLEANAAVTCNEIMMSVTSGTLYSTSIPYQPGSAVTITTFRPIDGSSSVQTFYP